MRKTLVYTLDALNPTLLHANLIKDINDETIKEILIPTFVLKDAYEKYNCTSPFSKVITQLQSEKITIKDFPVMYSENYSNFTYFILFMIKISKEYKNLYVRTRKNKIILECLKRGFKVFSDKERDNIFDNITSENSIVAQSSIAFFDTCYYAQMMFKDPYKGLNIFKDKNIKKIIFTSVLEELLKIEEIEVFKFLVYFINNKKDYNIELIITEKAYTALYNNNDLMMLSYVMTNKYSDKITVYTCDLNFIIQCMALKIKVSNGEVLNTNSISKATKTEIKNEIKKAKPEKVKEFLISDNITNELNKTLGTHYELNEDHKVENFLKLPIMIKNNIAYISTKNVAAVYTNIATGLYSNIYGKKGKEKYYQIRPNWYVKLPDNSKAYKVKRIDRNNLTITLEKTTLKI